MNSKHKTLQCLVQCQCLKTNNVYTLYRKAGISLRELKKLGSIPIIGEICNEFIPRNCDLYDAWAYTSFLAYICQWAVNQGPIQKKMSSTTIGLALHLISNPAKIRIKSKTFIFKRAVFNGFRCCVDTKFVTSLKEHYNVRPETS